MGTMIFRLKHKKQKRIGAEKILFIVVFIIFSLQAMTMVLPLIWMIISSCKGSLEYAAGDAFALPKQWYFSNYIQAFKTLNVGNTSFWGMIFNSIWYTAIVTSLTAFMPAITGYVFSKYNFKAKPMMFAIAITALTIPIVGSSASHMRIVSWLGIYNTPLYPIVTSLGGFGMTFLVYYGFFKSVSWAYAEAGMMDGAGPFTIFFKIMIPQAVPIIITYAITGAIATWNEYQTIILYLPSYPTLAMGLFEYQSNAIRLANYPIYFAGLLISMIPTLLIFGVFSNRIMTSLSLGGLKG